MKLLAKFAVITSVVALSACGSKPAATPTPPAGPKQEAPAPAHQTPPAAAPTAEKPVQAPTPAPAAGNPLNNLAQAAAAGTPPAGKTETPKLEDLGKLLGGITDGPTAQAAKSKIESLIQQLKTAKDAATSGQLGSDLGKLAGAAAAKAGVDLTALKAEAKKQVESLLGNAAVKGAIGPTLEQLKGLLQ